VSGLNIDTDHFSPDYATARRRFHDAARAAGAELHTLPLDPAGPAGEALAIDVAWLGERHPQRVVMHTVGLHGVEAFAGSAIQLNLLRQPPPLAAGDALVLVHVLNPFGMAWIRRTNENNVDLNRNFLKQGEAWSGAPDLYRRLDFLLNPPSLPGFDWFYLHAAWLALRHGYQPLKQGVAQGQYEMPRGLFYGGRQLEQGPSLYLAWLGQHLRGAQYLFALDVHTGLGDWGEEMLILDPVSRGTNAADLRLALDRPLIDATDGGSAPYGIRGGLGGILPSALPETRIDFLLQELGTYGPLRVLHALREENRWHYFGTGGVNHPAKKALLEALCPASIGWRHRAVAHGVRLAEAVANWAFSRNDK